jgi:hypothetical protein
VTTEWEARPTLAFAGSVLATLLTFRLLDTGIHRLAQLPAAAYEQGFFLDNVLVRVWRIATTRIPWWIIASAIVLVIGAFLLDERRLGGAGRRRFLRLFGGWRELEEGHALRWLVLVMTGLSAWALSCYPRNLYVDQPHLMDRFLIVALWLAIAWRPLCVLPFALAAAAVAGQFTVPLGFISWTEMSVVMRFPILFAAFWLVRVGTGLRRSDAFILAACCLLAATYWTSGLGKLRVDWLAHPHVHLLLLGAWANGWLAYLDANVVVGVAEAVARVARPLMLVTLALECGALILLWRRWSLVGFLLLAMTFHLVTFALTGIFFWKWIAVELSLLTYLAQNGRLARLMIFTPSRFVLSLAVIVASPLWVTTEDLTWFDTPLTYSLRFEGVAADGAVHALPAGFFRPYTEAVVLGTFPGISPQAQLTRAMGVTKDRRLAGMLVAARSAEEVFAIERQRGRIRADPAATAAFDDFVARHAANARCRAGREPLVLRVAGVPRHLWTFPMYASLPCDARLVAVRVHELTTFFDGDSLRLIRRQLVREIHVPESSRSALLPVRTDRPEPPTSTTPRP